MRLKILAAALAASLLAGACGGTDEASQSADPDTPPPSEMTIYALSQDETGPLPTTGNDPVRTFVEDIVEQGQSATTTTLPATTTSTVDVVVEQISHCSVEPIDTHEITEQGPFELPAGTWFITNTSDKGNLEIHSLDHPDDDFGIGWTIISAGGTSNETLAGGGYTASFSRGTGTATFERLR